MRALWSRQGGKSLLRNIIVKLFPPHDKYDTYVEPFVGAGWVFLNQKTDKEVINDLDPDMFHLWKDIQNISQSDADKMIFTMDKNKFVRFRDHGNGSTPAGRLYRNLYLSFMSFSGQRQQPNPQVVGDHNSWKKRLGEFQERLKRVVVLNQDYKSVIHKYDSPRTLFYLDPPYHELDGKSYSNKEIDYLELARLMATMKGYAVLSINDHPDIRNLFRGFRIKRVSVRYTSGQTGVARKELVVMNWSKEK